MPCKTDTDLKLTQLPENPVGRLEQTDRHFGFAPRGIRRPTRKVGRGLTSAAQLSRSWIDRRHKTLGFGRIADFQNLGYRAANAKNVRQAYDSEDTALVRELAKTEEGRSFLEALDAIINGEPAAADAKAHRIPPAAAAPRLRRRQRTRDGADAPQGNFRPKQRAPPPTRRCGPTTPEPTTAIRGRRMRQARHPASSR